MTDKPPPSLSERLEAIIHKARIGFPANLLVAELAELVLELLHRELEPCRKCGQSAGRACPFCGELFEVHAPALTPTHVVASADTMPQ
jgi:hypothetical protein